MGSSSDSTSNSTSQEYTNSLNTTVTQSISGAQDVGLLIKGDNTNSPLTYSYDSGNSTVDNNTNYALGAGSSATATGSPGTAAPSIFAGIDWSEVIVYVIGGILLVLVLRLFGDRNS